MQKHEDTRKKVSSLLQWRTDITELRRELEDLQKEKIKLDEAIEAFSSERIRLTQARLAHEIQHLYTTSSSLHRQLGEVQEKHSEAVRKVVSLETDDRRAHTQDSRKNRNGSSRQAWLSKLNGRLSEKCMRYDQSINDKKPVLLQNREKLRTMQLSLQKVCLKLKGTVEERENCLKKLSQAEDYLKQNPADGKLEQDMEEIRSRIKTLERLGKEESEILNTRHLDLNQR